MRQIHHLTTLAMRVFFVLCQLNFPPANLVVTKKVCTSDFVALDACDAYSSEASLKKILRFDNAKKNDIFLHYSKLNRIFALSIRRNVVNDAATTDATEEAADVILMKYNSINVGK